MFYFTPHDTSAIYTLSLHDALPIFASERAGRSIIPTAFWIFSIGGGVLLFAYSLYRRDPVFIAGQGLGLFIYLRNLRSEEHTSELQSRLHLVCRLLLEKKK